MTPAEELGLSGLSLASRVRKAFLKIPETDVLGMMQRIREASLERRLIYQRGDEVDTIRVMPCPLTVLPDQLAYIHYVTLSIQNALKRLPELYVQDFGIREILRLTPDEERWLWDAWGPSHRENNPIIGRLDAMIDFTSPMWKDSLRFVEPNLSGIGGLNLVPGCEAVVSEHVLPTLRKFDPELRLEAGTDLRELLMQDLLEHLDVVGRRGGAICLVEPKYVGYGPEEQAQLVQFYRQRHGMTVHHADPTELVLRHGEVWYEDTKVDLVYRDYPVLDLLDLEREGKNVEAMKHLFRENRVVSSIAAEMDQKSCWEILTDPQYTQKYFSADERQVFRRHVLWTRIVSDRRTLLSDGQYGDLLPFVRSERESLVLKPNRAFGGEGVILGHFLSQPEWEHAVDTAIADTQRWVVQQVASIPVSEFPVVDEQGRLHVEPFYTVMGFAPTRYGLAILGRASQKQVVNVAQRGGMCAVLVGRPPGRLIGPGMVGHL